VSREEEEEEEEDSCSVCLSVSGTTVQAHYSWLSSERELATCTVLCSASGPPAPRPGSGCCRDGALAECLAGLQKHKRVV